jgi:hypothetical protein
MAYYSDNSKLLEIHENNSQQFKLIQDDDLEEICHLWIGPAYNGVPYLDKKYIKDIFILFGRYLRKNGELLEELE